MDKKYSIFVNSCDAFEDCWMPFFTLYKNYWNPDFIPLYLNTETKNFTFENLNINCTKVQADALFKLTWSQCLINGLNKVNTEFVLYLQEDYFIHSRVNTQYISDAVNFMSNHPEVGMISLTSFGSAGPYDKYSIDTNFLVIKKNAKYRISTQAALWRVDTLKSYLEPNENGWMFEIFGTRRSRYRDDIFLVINDPKIGSNVINIIPNCIIKGKWLPEIVNVFMDHKIGIDFTKRGFYIPQKKLMRQLVLLSKLSKNPIDLVRSLFKK